MACGVEGVAVPELELGQCEHGFPVGVPDLSGQLVVSFDLVHHLEKLLLGAVGFSGRLLMGADGLFDDGGLVVH